MTAPASAVKSIVGKALERPAADRAPYLAHASVPPPPAPPGGARGAPPPAHPGENPGPVIAGRYKLLEEIGGGGMGTVWAGEQTQPVRRRVAGRLAKGGRASRHVLSRFEAERQ